MDVIKSIQSQIANHNFAFVPAKCMRSLLFDYTNFSEQDENDFRRFWDVAVPQKDDNVPRHLKVLEHGQFPYPIIECHAMYKGF